MLLVFQTAFFSSCNMGFGRRGRVGSRKQVKATFQTKRVILCLKRVTQTDTIHKGGQDWLEEQPVTSCSPINASQAVA